MAAEDDEPGQRIAAALSDQIRRTIEQAAVAQSASLQRAIASALMPVQQRWLGTAAKNLAPALKLNYGSLFPKFPPIQTPVVNLMQPALDSIRAQHREQFARLIEAARRAIEASLPPNWARKGADSIPRNLEALLLDEGLPLAWIPPPEIVALLFDAPDAASRRAIIGRRWKTITRHAAEQLDLITDPALTAYVEFAQEAANALLSGLPRASQALSTNLLDSILLAEFDHDSRRLATGKERLAIEDFPLRVAIVVGGVWGSYRQFWPAKGDPIPRRYSRHGSAHAVSRRQYSRVNAVIALMHVTSLLRLIDTDFRD